MVLGILVLASSASFGLGYLAGIDARQGSIDVIIGQTPTPGVGVPTGSVGIVASKNGTKYYLPECANTISEANKVWFVSADAARAAGYTPAANCKGL